MTEEQVVRYTGLAKRKSEIMLKNGVNWKKEYAEELKCINRELAEIKGETC